MTITFEAESARIESGPGARVLVTVEADPDAVARELYVSDRLRGLNLRDVIETIGAQALLVQFTEAELATWLASGDADLEMLRERLK